MQATLQPPRTTRPETLSATHTLHVAQGFLEPASDAIHPQ